MSISSAQPLANVRTRIRVNQVVHIRRQLPGKGQLTVAKNAEVTPADVVGKSMVTAGFSSVNLAKRLGVSRQQAIKFLQRPFGKRIYKGELLALRQGLFDKNIVISPTDGLIDEYSERTGELKLKLLPKEVSLPAGVYGIVDDVEVATNEVVIRTLVTQVYGLFGSGKERGGVLKIISHQGSLTYASAVTTQSRQHILVVGSLIYGEALRKAVTIGAQGIIAGGLNAADYQSMATSLEPFYRVGTDIGISIMATEGFGPIPIGDDIFQVIHSYNDKFVFLNGNLRQLLLPATKPDSILSLRKVSLPIAKKPAHTPEELVRAIKVGDRVRIIWPPFMGMQGTVIGIDQTATRLPSGIVSILVTVASLRRKIKVPYPNLEIISS